MNVGLTNSPRPLKMRYPRVCSCVAPGLTQKGTSNRFGTGRKPCPISHTRERGSLTLNGRFFGPCFWGVFCNSIYNIFGGMFAPKNAAKVGIKKKSLEFRDSFGTDGTISVLSVLIRYKNGTNFWCYYNAF